MNKHFDLKVLVLFSGLILLFASCKKETIAPPTVKLFGDGQPSSVSITTAGVSAEVSDQGGAEVKSRGFAYGVSGGAMDTIFCGSGTGAFSAELTGLQPNTTYVYEAFAKNAGGYGTSGKVTFTTRDYNMATVKTNEVENVSTTSATCGGNVTNDGGGSISDRGVCWSTNQNPVATGSHVSAGEGLGEFNCEMTGLSGGTTYYARAYARNEKGVAYGEERTFTTECLEFSVNVSADPSNGGSVSGGGSYQQGQSCTVTATANSGYAFQNWTENGSVVSTDANYTFTVNGNRTLVAHFSVQAPNEYFVNVSANPSNGGSVSGEGTYQQGQSCTVTATANSGYAFQNWTENGNEVSTDANYTFMVNANRDLVAVFSASSPYGWAEMVSIMVLLEDGNSALGTTVSFLNLNSQEQQNYPMEDVTMDETGYYMWDSFRKGDYRVTISKAGYATLIDEVSVWEDFFEISYSLNPNMEAPQGAINGRFSVSATQQVYFSQGNLQYRASTGTWQFAANQYDYIGNANSNISSSYSGWIDLFGWGTSGWNPSNTYYRPWDSDHSNGSLYGPPGQYDLTGSYANSDWGYYNAISNGGNTTHQWRTLTKDEWVYVFNTRNTSSGIRYAKAQVNNVNGVILLPDDWSTSYYSLSSTNNSGASFSSNVISASSWTSSLQAHGAVFLPAAGGRNGTSVFNVGSVGDYWSASYYASGRAWDVHFDDGYLSTGSGLNRCYGFSVRLVCPAQ